MDIDSIRIVREKLRRLERHLNRSSKDGADCCGISRAQCDALFEISKKDENSLVDLTQALGLDASTMSRTIDGMVHIGLVDRRLNPTDRRYVAIRLTAQGKKLHRTIDDSYNRRFSSLFELIPKNKHGQVIEAISLFLAAVEQAPAGLECGRAGRRR